VTRFRLDNTWLPDAHVEATTAGAVMLAGVLLKMGTYGHDSLLPAALPRGSTPRRRDGWPSRAPRSFTVSSSRWCSRTEKTGRVFVGQPRGLVGARHFAFHNISSRAAVERCWRTVSRTGALFMLVGMLYDRRHTFEIRRVWRPGHASRKLARFFLLSALYRWAALIQGVVGEYLVLLGTTSGMAVGFVGRDRRDPLRLYLLWCTAGVTSAEIHAGEKTPLPEPPARDMDSGDQAMSRPTPPPPPPCGGALDRRSSRPGRPLRRKR